MICRCSEVPVIVEKLADLHIEFENIHPFIDGNGRTGRLIINLELMKLGYPPIDIKFTDRMRYYDAFDAFYFYLFTLSIFSYLPNDNHQRCHHNDCTD